jgi:hypothetical protein
MPAAMIAHLTEIDLDPTAAAMEFATSLAPIFQAMYRPKAAVTRMITKAMRRLNQ